MSFQDYQYGPPQGTSGNATTSLILGILGLVVCSIICSPLAIMYGNRARREIDASGGRLGGGGQATAGIIMGWIGIGLLILGIVVVVVLIAVGVALDDTA